MPQARMRLFAVLCVLTLIPTIAFAQDVPAPPLPDDANNVGAWLFYGMGLLSLIAAALPGHWAFTRWLRKALTDVRGLMPKSNGGFARIGPMFAVAALALGLVACTGLGGLRGIKWPPVLQCAGKDVESSLISAVTEALAGGDWEQALEKLARKNGETALMCAVDLVRDDLARTAASTGQVPVTQLRAELFLAETGTRLE